MIGDSDDDTVRMAVSVAEGTMVHPGHAARVEQLQRVRMLAALALTLRHGGVHVIVRDEAAVREEVEAAQLIYGRLPIDVGILLPGQSSTQRRLAHACDVTVGVLDAFALDATRDQQIAVLGDGVSRQVPAAVVSDPGSVMILGINRQFEQFDKLNSEVTSVGELRNAANFARTLQDGVHFVADGEGGSPRLTQMGREKTHDTFGVVQPSGGRAMLFERRVCEAVWARRVVKTQDYDVVDGLVVRLPSGTLSEGSGFACGLRQAIEVKEGVAITDIMYPLAVTSCLEYFRRYQVVGGTSTAELMFTAELEGLFGVRVWDRRTTEEREVEQRHARDMARYLAFNQELARWDGAAGDHRNAFQALRDDLRNPSERGRAVGRLIGADFDEDQQTRHVEALDVLDEAIGVYNAVAQYGRMSLYPDHRGQYEQTLTALQDSLWADLREEISRWGCNQR
ncbi:hypothetical protein [Actinacidiphila rubida]|uniref:hypothetical protein n=1 Tax=Actinacidiphila rubida TaxID=310780 RepID=UPI00159F1AF6|nr:hypothetical protein [Actinacidiphila rubida]